jgi:hypothetical protein
MAFRPQFVVVHREIEGRMRTLDWGKPRGIPEPVGGRCDSLVCGIVGAVGGAP